MTKQTSEWKERGLFSLTADSIIYGIQNCIMRGGLTRPCAKGFLYEHDPQRLEEETVCCRCLWEFNSWSSPSIAVACSGPCLSQRSAYGHRRCRPSSFSADPASAAAASKKAEIKRAIIPIICVRVFYVHIQERCPIFTATNYRTALYGIDCYIRCCNTFKHPPPY